VVFERGLVSRHPTSEVCNMNESVDWLELGHFLSLFLAISTNLDVIVYTNKCSVAGMYRNVLQVEILSI